MNPLTSCVPEACPGAAQCGVHQEPTLRLPVIFERFQREARQAVFENGRYRCTFTDWGQGPPLVFVHGLADTSRCFLPLMALLSPNFRCVAYELPVGGTDGARLARYAHDHLCDDLADLLDHLEIKQTYLFGSSFGSTVALASVARQPFRFPRVILQAPVAYKPLRGLERHFAWLMSHLPGRVRRLPWREKILASLHRKAFLGQPLERWLHYLDYTGEMPIRTLGRQARLLHHTDLRSELSSIQQPVLLVCGEDDPISTLALAEEIMKACPAAGRAVLEGCGHLPMWTHPEALAEIVREFLTPPPARVPLEKVAP